MLEEAQSTDRLGFFLLWFFRFMRTWFQQRYLQKRYFFTTELTKVTEKTGKQEKACVL